MKDISFAFIYLVALLLFGCAWYGAEMLLYGSSQSSIVDMLACSYIAYRAAQMFGYDDEEEDK